MATTEGASFEAWASNWPWRPTRSIVVLSAAVADCGDESAAENSVTANSVTASPQRLRCPTRSPLSPRPSTLTPPLPHLPAPPPPPTPRLGAHGRRLYARLLPLRKGGAGRLQVVGQCTVCGKRDLCVFPIDIRT